MAEAAPGKLPAPVASPVPASTPAASVSLQSDFTAAAAEFHVPVGVLLAVSYQETLWESHQGRPSATGNYNVMGLTQVNASDLRPLSDAEKKADLDARGDGRKRPAPTGKLLAQVDTVDTSVPALHTLDAAAALTKQPAAALRDDMRQSVRGGAALLASYEQKLNGSLPTDPGQWYAAVATYSQGQDAGTARQFADRVYTTMAQGASRTTSDNQSVTLAALPSVRPQTSATARLGLAPRDAGATATACSDIPSGLTCGFVPAAASNFDVAQRLTDGDTIRYIVLHDTEGSATGAVTTFATANSGVSAHYVVAATGGVTQMVQVKDSAIHADNKTVNMHSIGVENEGFALQSGSWFSEQEYQTSAALVKNLAKNYGIPLDRDHILGHDDAPYALDLPALGSANPVVSQHYDPGPYWDWSHFMTLLGAPLSGNGTAVVGGTVTVAPPYTAANEPALTGCTDQNHNPVACTARPANFVYLHNAASATAPLIGDSLLNSVGMASAGTTGGDVSDKAVYGQTFVVADIAPDWTAIWFGGKKAWFYNPGGQNAYANSNPALTLISPKASAAIPVYGRAYPETSAYPASLSTLAASPLQQLTPLPYTIPAGQAYVAAAEVAGDYYNYDNNGCSPATACTELIGTTQYYPIRYNHRIAYVMASDVQTTVPLTPPTGTYVPVTPTRVLDTRNGTGGFSQPVGVNSMIALQVAGTATVPATGVTAVVMNVTATGGSADSWVTVSPDGPSRPNTSNLNFPAGRTVPNLVTVPVVNGKVDFYNAHGTVNLLADLVGYYTSTGGGSTLVSAGPTRVLDTRSGIGGFSKPVGDNSTISLQVANVNGAPANTTAVVMNVTATGATADSFVTVYPGGQARPNTSNLNVGPGRTTPNLSIVPVVNGKVNFYNAHGTVNLFADVTGYFTSDAGSVFHTLNPTRLLDTRYGVGGYAAPVGAGATIGLQVAGNSGIPLKGVTAVVMNVTATGPNSWSFVTVYPDGTSRPNASSLNVSPGLTVPNLVIIPVVNGRIDFYNSSGSLNLFADVTGYFTSS
ncbi:N-acetylmuramoyl-L-alanine amidase [Streptacidiphilus sp. MAP12-16]|uniref:N-acetylmuramoyl-L-alanine amidase n=1 Tax=Streptacidiphilus sp. MAP12-16 TaxID=3156300 RepID=UPI003514425D